MNNDRRKEINKAIALMQEALAILETARNEEQDYYDNMPENLQSSDRGCAAEAAASDLDDACSSLEDVIGSAENSLEA